MDFRKIFKRKTKNQEVSENMVKVAKEENINISETNQNAVTEEVSETATESELNEKDKQILHEFFEDALHSAFRQMPIWARLNYFAHSIGNASDKAVNWNKVNDALMFEIDKTKPYYNIYGRLSSAKQVREAAVEAKMAFMPELERPFFRRKCKQCGEDFELTLGEINSYEKKGLHIPGRCYYCRKGIDRNTGNPILSGEVSLDGERLGKKEDSEKTAMQIAMEKAGIV